MDAARVYVAGPYTQGDPAQNTAKAIEAGNHLLDLGFAPFVPHLAHYWDRLHFARSYVDWMMLDIAWLKVADAVLRIGGYSPGADKEVDTAKDYGIPVFTNFPELENWRNTGWRNI